MDRTGYGAELLGRLPRVQSVLDVGCREAHIADRLPSEIEYFGADLEPLNPRIKYVGDFSVIDFDRTFSAVVALDILEHTEKPSANFDKLVSLADEHLVVSLPNCADLKTRTRFLGQGRLGGKYLFDGTDPLDRHRWVMNYDEIVTFFRNKADRWNLEVKVVPMTYGSSGNSTAIARLGRILSKVLPTRLTAETVVGIFSKR